MEFVKLDFNTVVLKWENTSVVRCVACEQPFSLGQGRLRQGNNELSLSEASRPPVVVGACVDQFEGDVKLNCRSVLVWTSVCLFVGCVFGAVAS